MTARRRISLAVTAALCSFLNLYAQTLDLPLSPAERWETLGPAIGGSAGPIGRIDIRVRPDGSESLTAEQKPFQEVIITGIGSSLSTLNMEALDSLLHGNDRKARDRLQQVLGSLRSSYRAEGGVQQDIASTLTNLGLLSYGKRRFAEAGRYFDTALMMNRILSRGADNPHLAASICNTAMFIYNRGKWKEAGPLLEEGMAMWRRLSEAGDCSGLAGSLYAMGVFYDRLRDSARAGALFEESLRLRRASDTTGADPGLASALDAVSGLYYRRGEYAAASRLLAECLGIRRHLLGADANPEIARGLCDLGMIRERLGDYVGADSLLSGALGMALGLAKWEGDTFLLRCRCNLGDLRCRRGDLAGGMPVLEDVVKIYERYSDSGTKLQPELAVALIRLGRACMQGGDYLRADTLFGRALKINRAHPSKGDRHRIDRPEHAAALAGEGIARYRSGEYKGVAAPLAYALGMYRNMYGGRDDLDFAEALAEYGNFHRIRGEYPKANEKLGRSRSMYGHIDDAAHDPGYARCLSYSAEYYHERGDLQGAEGLLDSALRLRRTLFGGADHHDLADNYRAIGVIREERGDTAGARLALDTAVAMLRRLYRGGDHFDLAMALSAAGRLRIESGNSAGARPFLEDALGMFTRLCAGKDLPDLANAMRDLAIFHASQGDSARAGLLFDSALAMYHRLYDRGFHLDLALSIAVIARFSEKFGDLERAKRSYVELLGMLPQITRESSLFEGEARQLKFQERLTRASDAAASFFLRRGMAPELYDVALWSKGRVLAALGWRNRVLMEMGMENPRVRGTWRQWEMMRREISDTRVHADTAEFGRWHAGRERMIDELNHIEDSLAQQSATLQTMRQRSSWHTVRNSLVAGKMVVEFMRVSHGGRSGVIDSVTYCALVMSREYDEPVIVPLCREERIKRILLRCSVDLRKKDSQSYIHDAGQNRALYDLIWGPVDRLVRGAGIVYISPDGVLNLVAFGPLKNSAGGMLLDNYDLRYLFSSHDLVDHPLIGTGMSAYPKTAAVFGGIRYDADSLALARAIRGAGRAPSRGAADYGKSWLGDFPSRETSDSAPLPWLAGTRAEASETADTLERHGYTVTRDTGVQATEEAFIRLASPTVLHVATHGFFFDDPVQSAGQLNELQFPGGVRMVQYAEDPLMRSGLLFAGANHIWTGHPPVADIGDGIVTAYDVAHMDLSHTELVALSACETGQGHVMPSEGVFGLKRAFRAAGAMSVMISLWKVPDRETQMLMKLFYQNWLEKGMDKGGALTQAQRTMARTYSDPYFWGAFVLVGE